MKPAWIIFVYHCHKIILVTFFMKKGAYDAKVPVLGPRRVIFVSVNREKKTETSKASCSESKVDTCEPTGHSNDTQL